MNPKFNFNKLSPTKTSLRNFLCLLHDYHYKNCMYQDFIEAFISSGDNNPSTTLIAQDVPIPPNQKPTNQRQCPKSPTMETQQSPSPTLNYTRPYSNYLLEWNDAVKRKNPFLHLDQQSSLFIS